MNAGSSPDRPSWGDGRPQTGTGSQADNATPDIIEAMIDGVVIARARGGIIRLNKAFENITGYSKQDLIPLPPERMQR
ncbi:MAG: PAS domain-containing protein [Chloroflexi bacterium]|nr:PAS domain-containing protein [Chloroflexota bacterium]